VPNEPLRARGGSWSSLAVLACALQLALLLAFGAQTAVAAAPTGLAAAQQALATGRYEDAERGFRALLDGQNRGAALLGLARVQLQTGRYEEAEQSAASAATVQSWGARAHTVRGEALAARGQLDAAQTAYEQAARTPTALRAKLLLGRLLVDRGKTAQAEPHLQALIEAYNDDQLGPEPAAALCYVAMAARALGSLHDANDAFREAALKDPARVETQLEWAALFLDKNDQRHAQESIDDALARNPNSPDAHVLNARVVLARAFDFPAAEAELQKALAVNPKLVSAHVTRATMALREMDIDAADRLLDAALAINPSDLEALSVRAAVRFLADDARGFERAKKTVLQLNPRFSRLFSIVAEYAEWEHRYEELVQLARDALKIDPEDALAHATLGINLLRQGQQEDGLTALRAAWKRDRFNVFVFNTLNFYEQVLDQQYVSFEAAPFTMRMHKDERAALEPYVPPMLQRAYADMVKRYGFTPKGPLSIELYAEVEHFSVRTTGLPNVGVQGVCFGKVVTALSPRGGPFNWGQITWHELAHIFHLQLSKNRVPRWFTEGLAEYETIIARPEWKREEDYELWVALRQQRVPRVRDLNKAFTQARTPQDLMTAYYVASQVIVYMVDRFGFAKVRPMLEAWGKGMRTEVVVRQVLGIDIDALDADFRAATAKRLQKFDDDFFVDFSRYDDLPALEAAAKKTPDDAGVQAGLALALVGEGRFDDAERAAKRALKLAPKNALAHFALTRVALEHGDAERAKRCLEAIVKNGQDGYILRVLLARAALAGKDPPGARRQAEQAVALDPDQTEAWHVLLEVASKQDDRVLARRALTALADLDQHDRIAHIGLMGALFADKAYPELVKAGERALFVDPENPQLHRLYAEGALGSGDPALALRELDRALALKHPRPADIQLSRARALRALGRKQDAAKAVAEAVRLDPKLADKGKTILAP
jgi:cellulose synthase operon protein C